MPTPDRLFEVLDRTWPAAASHKFPPWLLREGENGGQRVSAATLESTFVPEQIAEAEHKMRELGQHPLFMIRDGDQILDDALATRGYQIVDPVQIYAIDASTLARDLPLTEVMPAWPPLAVQLEIWAGGGIGPDRVRIMDRCEVAKMTFLGRHGDVPAGTAFVGCCDKISMLHAIEVGHQSRRQGVGRRIMQTAARWSIDEGACCLCLAVTKANTAANALYESLGMKVAAEYHYRRAAWERSA